MPRRAAWQGHVSRAAAFDKSPAAEQTVRISGQSEARVGGSVGAGDLLTGAPANILKISDPHVNVGFRGNSVELSPPANNGHSILEDERSFICMTFLVNRL
jgi:hypothetical protein